MVQVSHRQARLMHLDCPQVGLLVIQAHPDRLVIQQCHHICTIRQVRRQPILQQVPIINRRPQAQFQIIHRIVQTIRQLALCIRQLAQAIHQQAPTRPRLIIIRQRAQYIHQLHQIIQFHLIHR